MLTVIYPNVTVLWLDSRLFDNFYRKDSFGAVLGSNNDFCFAGLHAGYFALLVDNGNLVVAALISEAFFRAGLHFDVGGFTDFNRCVCVL